MNSRSLPAKATGSSLLVGRKPVNYNNTVNEYNNNNNNNNNNSNNNDNNNINNDSNLRIFQQGNLSILKILLSLRSCLHPKSNTNRIYIPRKEGGRGLLSIEDTVDLAKLGLKSYVRNSFERLLVAARQIEDCQGESVIEFKNRKKIERQQEWKDKTLHGQFLRQTDGEAGKE